MSLPCKMATATPGVALHPTKRTGSRSANGGEGCVLVGDKGQRVREGEYELYAYERVDPEKK